MMFNHVYSSISLDPACQNINVKHSCYVSDPSCPNLQNNDFNGDVLNTNSFLYAILAILTILTIAIVSVLLFCIWRRRERNASM